MATRSNTKINVIEVDNSIKKSNEFSLAKLNHGLTLNQMQLLAYFIYCTQQTGTTTFQKADFEKKFEIEQYKTPYAKADADKLFDLKISTSDLENDEFSFWRVFTDITYKRGTFTFTWHPKFLPHIMNLKENYIINNLSMTSHFKSSYSWILYETIKAHYNFFHKIYTKEELLTIFNVEKNNTYIKNTGRFKQTVLDVAIKEINEYTELNVSYKEIKEGRKVVAFDLHWSTGKQLFSASPKLMNEIKTLFETIEDMSSEILLIPVPKAQEVAMGEFRNVVELKKQFKSKEFMTKEEAEIMYRSLGNAFETIDHAIHYPNSHRYVLYNWLEERDEEPSNN